MMGVWVEMDVNSVRDTLVAYAGAKMLKYSKQPYNLSLTALGLPASQFSHLSHGNAVAQLPGAPGKQIH